MVIISNSQGQDLRAAKFHSYDFEVGDAENSFEVVFIREEWEDVPMNSLVFINETEIGGIVKRIGTDTSQNTVTIGGYTWRGLLQKQIIAPASGQDYRIVSGDVNDIIGEIVAENWTPLFSGSGTQAGVSVTSYQFNRYCTAYDGLKAMLATVDMRLELIKRSNGLVEISAVPIEDYSQNIVFSADMRMNYRMAKDKSGVDCLVCLGQGELKNRIVRYIYANGQVRTTPKTTKNLIYEVYDNPGAELDDLITGGKDRMEEVKSTNDMDITVDPDTEIAVGDIVGGVDYITGMSIKAPVTGKIYRWQNGLDSIEYEIGEAEEVTE